MSKIFGIGLPKTGTWSLCLAMKLLGFKSLHFIYPGDFKYYKNTIDNYDFVNDCPISYIFDELSKEYPDSKFICTTRNLDSWLKSSNFFFKKNRFEKSVEHLNILFESPIFQKEKFIKCYENHAKKVEIFSRTNSVLYLPLEYEDKWDLICSFLKIKKINRNYPYINKSKVPFL